MISSAMSQNNANQFPTESFSLNNIQLVLLVVGFVEFFLLRLLTDSKRISHFFLGFQPLSKPVKEGVSESSIKHVTGGDVDIVLKSLGIYCNSGEEKLPASIDADHLVNLFDEESPSVDEVREAFDVFDSNKDGFIDAKELQKVLCALGLKEGSELEKCTRMIGVFDENRDGRMDFDEFVKFIETSLC